MNLSRHIRTIPDFPKPGILFYDISTLLLHPAGWQVTVERMAEAVEPHEPHLLAGIESRGFLVAAPLALKLGLGFGGCVAGLDRIGIVGFFAALVAAV